VTQVTKHRPSTPRQAARRSAPLDKALDADLFKALSDPTRLKLLACLAKCGRMCSVTEVAECCSVDFSVVSRHLAMLADAGVLDFNKDGRTTFYQVRYEHLGRAFRALADAFSDCSPSCCNEECCDTNCCGNKP
jgi:ArsR family transcriptional regulator